MKICIRCGNEVKELGRGVKPHEQGYETQSGEWVHDGCSLLMNERPKPKGSLKELLMKKGAK